MTSHIKPIHVVPMFENFLLKRNVSFFLRNIEEAHTEIKNRIACSRILVIGAAGSIGSAFVKEIVAYSPRALWLVDLSENNLVEVVRDLRSSEANLPDDFGTVAIGFGSVEFDAFLRSVETFEYILNFAALKHVRSERYPFSLMRLINVNILCN